MRPETIRCLDRVEATLDPAHLARTRQLWDDCRHYRPVSHLPVVVGAQAPEWPSYTMSEIQSDMEKMLVSELGPVYASALIGDGKAWWRSLITLRNLNAVNPFQGQFYDPVEMHQACRDAGVMIWQWTTGLTPVQRARIRTGFTLIQWVGNIDAGKRLMEAKADTRENS